VIWPGDLGTDIECSLCEWKKTLDWAHDRGQVDGVSKTDG
jgi:hypothetical protein